MNYHEIPTLIIWNASSILVDKGNAQKACRYNLENNHDNDWELTEFVTFLEVLELVPKLKWDQILEY